MFDTEMTGVKKKSQRGRSSRQFNVNPTLSPLSFGLLLVVFSVEISRRVLKSCFTYFNLVPKEIIPLKGLNSSALPEFFFQNSDGFLAMYCSRISRQFSSRHMKYELCFGRLNLTF